MNSKLYRAAKAKPIEVDRDVLMTRNAMEQLALVLSTFVQGAQGADQELRDGLRATIGPHLQLLHESTGILLDVIGEPRGDEF